VISAIFAYLQGGSTFGQLINSMFHESANPLLSNSVSFRNVEGKKSHLASIQLKFEAS
jgi:hypothetical protein